MLKLILPWLSISLTFTVTSSPTASTSSILSILLLDIFDIWSNPSFPPPRSTNAPNDIIFVTTPSYIPPGSISLVIVSIIFNALFAFSESFEYMNTLPSSSISIFTPVSSIILFIVFPPVPITSFILSTGICVETIFGAYLDISVLGFSITGNITLSNI